MRIRFFLFVAILFFSCGNSEQKALQKVLQLERVLMLAEDVSSNEVLARKVLQEYTLFLELYPDADVAPELYFKSIKRLSLLLYSSNNFERSILSKLSEFFFNNSITFKSSNGRI